MDSKIIAKNLLDLRVKKGVSQAEVAKSIGISPSSWSMYEHGERVPRDRVKQAIASYFKTSVQRIFFTQR